MLGWQWMSVHLRIRTEENNLAVVVISEADKTQNPTAIYLASGVFSSRFPNTEMVPLCFLDYFKAINRLIIWFVLQLLWKSVLRAALFSPLHSWEMHKYLTDTGLLKLKLREVLVVQVVQEPVTNMHWAAGPPGLKFTLNRSKNCTMLTHILASWVTERNGKAEEGFQDCCPDSSVAVCRKRE